MSVASYLIYFSGLSIELLVVYRLLIGRFWKHYPYFSSYVFYLVAQSIAQFSIHYLAPALYAKTYWYTVGFDLFLRFFVIWEVFRHSFLESSVMHKMTSKGFMFGILGMLLLLVAVWWGAETYQASHSVWFGLLRTLSFCQASLIMAVLFLAKYYGVHLGQNVWGMAIGFGLFCSFSVVNFALIDLAPSFFPYWQLLIPFGFVSMMLIWMRAMWVYSPNPAGEAGSLDHGKLEQWSHDWNHTVSTIRRLHGHE